MKRLSLLLLLLSILLPLSAVEVDVASDLGVPPSVVHMLSRTLTRAVKGRYEGDARACILAYRIDEEHYGEKSLVFLEYEFLNRTHRVVESGKDIVAAIRSLPRAVEDELRYESVLMMAPPRLDYQFGISYSSLIPDAHKGDVYRLVGVDGKTYGAFTVDDTEEGVAIFSPLQRRLSSPGMRMDRSGSNFLSFQYAPVFTVGSRAAFSLSYHNSAFLYPFNPQLSFDFGYSYDKPYFYGGLGLSYTLHLSALFNSHLSIAEEGSIAFSVLALWGQYDGHESYGAKLSILYQYFITDRLYGGMGTEIFKTMCKGDESISISQVRLLFRLGVRL